MPVGGGHYRRHRRKQTAVGRTIRIPCGKAVIELPAGMVGDEMGLVRQIGLSPSFLKIRGEEL
jgi:hypothetical protein